MLGIPKSLVIWVPPSYLFICSCFFNSRQPNRPKIKRKSKITKAKVILLSKGLEIWQYVGDTQIPSDMGTPSYLFICSRFFNSRQANRPKIKGQRKLTKPKVILLRKGLETVVEICQNVGDTKIPSDMGTPFLSVCLSSFR